MPTEVPVASRLDLTFSSSVIVNWVTVCWLEENWTAWVVSPCDVVSNKVSCTFTKRTNKVWLCCYNTWNNLATIAVTASWASLVLPVETAFSSFYSAT